MKKITLATSSSCTNGKFRLSNGNNDNQGRVEYCYEGEWTAMCSLMMQAARMICEHLGYIECMLSLKDKINIYIQFMHQC